VGEHRSSLKTYLLIRTTRVFVSRETCLAFPKTGVLLFSVAVVRNVIACREKSKDNFSRGRISVGIADFVFEEREA